MKKQYTKKQIQEAISYWQKQLEMMNKGAAQKKAFRKIDESQFFTGDEDIVIGMNRFCAYYAFPNGDYIDDANAKWFSSPECQETRSCRMYNDYIKCMVAFAEKQGWNVTGVLRFNRFIQLDRFLSKSNGELVIK